MKNFVMGVILQQSQRERLKETAMRLGIKAEQMPRHIAIIMDGNGRWATKRGLPRIEGHGRGGRTVEKIAQLCVDLGFDALTLYSFSVDNWKRPRQEVESLMHIYTRYLVEIRPTLMRNNVRLAHLGNVEQLPDQLQLQLAGTMKLTAANTGMVLALALNYGGRTEITDAVRKIACKVKSGILTPGDIDEKCVANHLYTAGLPDPDLLIRTSDEMRVSNFLLWQISYTEFYVTRVLWPDFGRRQLERAVRTYADRRRRFGSI